MSSFPHAIVIGIVTALITFFGIFLKKRSWILVGMLLSLTTASPMFTFTRGAAGAIVSSDAVAFVLLLGLIFGSFKPISSSVVPKWRRPFIILFIVWLLSVLLIASWNMPGLMQTFGWRARSVIPLPLNVQITGFRIFRILLLISFFLVVSKLTVDDRSLQRIFLWFCIITALLATAQVLIRLNIVDLQLQSSYVPWGAARGYVLGYTKLAANRILFVGFFVSLILAYRTNVTLKGLYLALSILVVVSIFFGGSRATLFGLMVGMMVLTVRTKITYLPLVLIFVGGLGLAGFFIIRQWQPELFEPFEVFLPGRGVEVGGRGYRAGGRIEIMLWVLKYLIQNPLSLMIGVGFMNYAYALEPVGGISSHAHNDFITCLAELGIVGLVVFIWWLASLGRKLWSVGRKTVGQERWTSACINAGFWGLISVTVFERTFFPAGGSLSLHRLEIILFGSFIAYHIQRHAAEHALFYYGDGAYEELEYASESYT